MQIPEKLLNSLVGIEGFNKDAFENIHNSGEQVTSVRLNASKCSVEQCNLPIDSKVPWTEHGYYLRQRPSFTFDPLFHAGCYYVQEASSMFLEQALRQACDLLKPLKILDLAAAPGGKSTHIQSLITKDSLLVSNEVIRSRANILKDNIIKWGSDNVVITNNDPRVFSRMRDYFDVIVIDAPCSGSGLFRRDEEAIKEWSENNVALCSQRQQRIVADVLPALKKEGIMIYSTCSYSKEEDEEIVQWMGDALAMENSPMSTDPAWGIIKTSIDHELEGYRFWPDRVKGEGFFIACLKKSDGNEQAATRVRKKMELLDKRERSIVDLWVKQTDHEYVKIQNEVFAIPGKLMNEFNYLSDNLHLVYLGTMIGEIIREKLIPAHSLALSGQLSDTIERVELDRGQAISFLKRKELQITAGRGWKVASFEGKPLGWINVLPNRINNYYPKELRILKDI